MDENKRELINSCIKDIKNGNYEKITDLYTLFSPNLYYIAVKYFKGEDVKDFVQDFWSEIVEICHKYWFVSNGFGYLMKVAENMARNRYNKNKQEKTILVADIKELVKYSIDDNLNEDLENNDIILQFFKELDDVENVIVTSYYYGGKTIREIARELGIAKSTVEYKKLKALEKLEKFL